jgi:hypothetical protein
VKKPPEQPWCELIPIREIIDGDAGEFAVKVLNRSERALPGGRLSLRDRGAAKAPLFAITPSQEDGGYDLARIPVGGIRRTFCIRPVHAEVGHHYDIEVVLQARGDAKPAPRERDRGEPAGESEGEQSARFRVEVLARPEVYAAIGAVETLRDTLLDRYKEWIAKGRATNRNFETMLPRSPSPDAVQVALGRQSFDFLMQALDLGLRIVQAPTRPPRPPKPGKDSDGAP